MACQKRKVNIQSLIIPTSFTLQFSVRKMPWIRLCIFTFTFISSLPCLYYFFGMPSLHLLSFLYNDFSFLVCVLYWWCFILSYTWSEHYVKCNVTWKAVLTVNYRRSRHFHCKNIFLVHVNHKKKKHKIYFTTNNHYDEYFLYTVSLHSELAILRETASSSIPAGDSQQMRENFPLSVW